MFKGTVITFRQWLAAQIQYTPLYSTKRAYLQAGCALPFTIFQIPYLFNNECNGMKKRCGKKIGPCSRQWNHKGAIASEVDRHHEARFLILAGGAEDSPKHTKQKNQKNNNQNMPTAWNTRQCWCSLLSSMSWKQYCVRADSIVCKRYINLKHSCLLSHATRSLRLESARFPSRGQFVPDQFHVWSFSGWLQTC